MDSVSNASLPIIIEEDSHPFLDPDEILDAISLSAEESLQKLLPDGNFPHIAINVFMSHDLLTLHH